MSAHPAWCSAELCTENPGDLPRHVGAAAVSEVQDALVMLSPYRWQLSYDAPMVKLELRSLAFEESCEAFLSIDEIEDLIANLQAVRDVADGGDR